MASKDTCIYVSSVYVCNSKRGRERERGKNPKKGFNDMDYLVFTSITTYPEELFMIMLVAASAAAATASKVP